MSDIDYNNSIKIIILGEIYTGKTNLINSYFDIPFDVSSAATLTSHLSQKVVQINNKTYTINMWDTAGQEKYRSITKLFINGSNIVILVYDITREETFKELPFWYETATNILGDNIIFGVCGNKIDLFWEQKIEKAKGIEFAESKGAFFTETSSKDDPKAFQKFVDKLIEKFLTKNGIINNIGEKLSPKRKKKGKCFC